MCLMRVERSACFGLFWHFFDSFGSMFCCFVFFDLIICPCPFFLFLYQVFSVLFVCLFVCVSQAVAVSAVGPSLGMAPKLLTPKIEGYVLLMFY